MYIYCSTCKNHFAWTSKNTKDEDGKMKKTEPKCGFTKSNLSTCKNFYKHKYKVRVHIPDSNEREISKTLEATTYKDAVMEAIEFEEEFIQSLRANSEIVVKHQGTRGYLFDAQIAYLDFLANVNVPDHQKVVRSEKHIKEQQKCLFLFNESLKKNKVDKKLLMIHRITDIHVGYYHTYLIEDQKYQSKTYNNKMSSLKSFFEWAIDEYELNIKNPFNKAKRRTVMVKKDTISKEEFNQLLKILTPERGYAKGRAKNRDFFRNLYKPYLRDGIELALHTGGRREEIVELKWNMIEEINGKPSYFAINNFKVQRQLGTGFNENVAPKIIPITKSLLKLLLRLGYKQYKNEERYLICPDRSDVTKNTIMDNLSRGFSHYYSQLNTDRNLQFKCLRKTYLTYLDIATNGKTKTLSSHTSDNVLKKHYIDEKIVSTAIANLNILG
ncbi:hypothetical protein [Aquimarina algiphila]|uniref:hypothetical protein n=1 Tax=Aquimarina algiphila TaxID=2047982 RepID=UPI00232BD54F|nr:hypothetical protein [Aquimarina algiphila]